MGSKMLETKELTMSVQTSVVQDLFMFLGLPASHRGALPGHTDQGRKGSLTH